MLQPKLLLLDELSAALAPQVMQGVFQRIVAIAPSGIGVRLVGQNVKAALPNSDYAYALQVVRNALEGSGAELLKDTRLQDVYLGGSGGGCQDPAEREEAPLPVASVNFLLEIVSNGASCKSRLFVCDTGDESTRHPIRRHWEQHDTPLKERYRSRPDSVAPRSQPPYVHSPSILR